MIEKVYVLNLDRCPERYWGVMASLELAGVPYEIIERFRAKDGQDYKTVYDVVDGMIDDGFREFQVFYEMKPHPDVRTPKRLWQGPKNVCVSWGFVSILRQIVDEGVPALVLEDDIHLRRDSFKELCKTVEQLLDFEMVMLNSFQWNDRSEWGAYCLPKQEEFLKELRETPFEHIKGNAFGMGSRARVFTVEGAQRFLEESLKRPWVSNELVSWFMRVDGVSTENYYLWTPKKPKRITDLITDLRFLGED